MLTITCSKCGNSFKRFMAHIRSRIVYCSRECRRNAKRREVVCGHCGAEFVRYLSKLKSKNFCSQECKKLASKGQPSVRKGQFFGEERFWSRVKKTDACWEWMGHRESQGYGRFGWHKNPWLGRAHRFAWHVSYGPVPDGLFVLHRCDNPPCVRPDHLFLGTAKDNMQDCLKKGRKIRKG